MEIEVKVRFNSREEMEKVVAKLDAKIKSPRHFEANVILDTPQRIISVSGCLLRIRKDERGALLTFKGKHVRDPRFKVRPEKEVRIDSFENILDIFHDIGFMTFFRYEKYRETWEFKNGTEMAIDELPFGFFMELEGEKEGIDEVASLMGIEHKDFINRTYSDLYGEYCMEGGIPFGDIVFEHT